MRRAHQHRRERERRRDAHTAHTTRRDAHTTRRTPTPTRRTPMCNAYAHTANSDATRPSLHDVQLTPTPPHAHTDTAHTTPSPRPPRRLLPHLNHTATPLHRSSLLRDHSPILPSPRTTPWTSREVRTPSSRPELFASLTHPLLRLDSTDYHLIYSSLSRTFCAYGCCLVHFFGWLSPFALTPSSVTTIRTVTLAVT